MKIKLCGVELELGIDMTDADKVEKLEEKVEILTDNLSKIELQKKKFSQIIREEVECTSSWLNEMFGEGTGKKVLKENISLQEVYGIVWTMNNLHRLHMNQIVSDALAKYSPDRALRK